MDYAEQGPVRAQGMGSKNPEPLRRNEAVMQAMSGDMFTGAKDPRVSYPSVPPLPKGDQAGQIVQMGFGYLFVNKNYSEQQVVDALTPGIGLNAYSMMLSRELHSTAATVLFRCAQMVFTYRRGMIPLPADPVFIAGSYVIKANDLDSLGLGMGTIHETLQELSSLGVLVRHAAYLNGGIMYEDWYTFAYEHQWFPEIGQTFFS